MGGRFGPRLFTGKTEHNRDYVVAKRDDGPVCFPLGQGILTCRCTSTFLWSGWLGGIRRTSETSSEESAGLRTAQERMTQSIRSPDSTPPIRSPDSTLETWPEPIRRRQTENYPVEAPLTADRLASRFGHAADDGALSAADVEHPVGAGSDFGFCGAAGFAGRRLEGVSAPFVRHGLRRRLTRGQRQSPLWELDYIMATASSVGASLQPAWRRRAGDSRRDSSSCAIGNATCCGKCGSSAILDSHYRRLGNAFRLGTPANGLLAHCCLRRGVAAVNLACAAHAVAFWRQRPDSGSSRPA